MTVLELRDTSAELVDRVISTVFEVVIVVMKATKFIRCLIVLVVSTSEIIARPFQGVPDAFEVGAERRDFVSKRPVVVTQRGNFCWEGTANVSIAALFSFSEGGVFLKDAFHVVMNPRGTRITGVSLVGDNAQPVIVVPGCRWVCRGCLG